MNSKIALLNDQLKVSRNANVQEKTRYHHEIRKRDKEIEKLKQKLLKLSSASTRSDQKIKIPKILNKPTLVKHNSLMVVNKVEEREKELLIENQALKNSIQAIYTAINAKRDVHIAIDDIQIARFTLPYSSIKDSVETMVFESLEQLNVQELAPVVSYNDSENVHLLNENKTLKTQLNEQFDVINQQNRLLEMSMNADFYIVDQVDESDTVFEKTSVELKQMALNVSNREQKLKKDRMLFTEAAIKLGFERKMLDNEKIRLGLDVPENKSPPGTAKKVTFTPSMDRIHEFSESLEESMIENVNDYSEMETIKTPISCRGLREEKDYSEIKTPTRVLRESNSIIGTPFGRTPMKDSLFSAPLSDLKVRKIEERILEMQKTPIRRLKRM